MMRIEMIWLALGASDLRGGIDILLAQVLRGFADGAQAHHAYVFANRRADRLKVLVYGVSRTRAKARDAVSEMGKGLPKSACRSRLETARCCCVQKAWW